MTKNITLELYESINGVVIPLENIDFICEIERPYTWGYKVYLKSGSHAWISCDDVRAYAVDDRKKLIEKLKNYTSNKST